jgi:leucyl aminopeptidase (aminopeptidase T)
MSLERAVDYILQCTGLVGDDAVVIVTDGSVMRAMKLLEEAALWQAKSCVLFDLDGYGERPLAALPAEISAALDECTVCYVAVRSVATAERNELATVRRPIALHSDRIKHINMPGLTYEVLESAFQDDPKPVWDLSRRVYDVLSSAKEISVRGENGTDAVFAFSEDLRWINLDGDFRERFVPKGSNNLPGAEVYTCPASCDGIYVVDGVLGDHFSERYGLIADRPVTFVLRDGRIAAVDSSDKALAAAVRNYMTTDENANRIGEFALGTNTTLDRLLGNMLHDEKFPSVHIAAGSPYPHVTGATWDSSAHMDSITLAPTVVADGVTVMEKGKYLV